MAIIENMLSGFSRFREAYYGSEHGLYSNLTKIGQRPQMLVISCSDSRVDPAILFGTEPGDLFMVRNVANLVPTYAPDDRLHGTSTAIEYAVRDLGVPDILVLGHAQCGGIGALCSHATGQKLAKRDFLSPWLSIASKAIQPELEKDDPATLNQRAEQACIRQSLQNLRTFPWISRRLEDEEIRLHGWWFDLEHGAMWVYEDESDQFVCRAS